jgi:hypothetical protein
VRNEAASGEEATISDESAAIDVWIMRVDGARVIAADVADCLNGSA